jgi:hypothetical protein
MRLNDQFCSRKTDALVCNCAEIEVSRAEIEIDRHEMIGDIAASRPINVLVKVTCFDSASPGEVVFPAEAQEESVLIEPAVGSPVRVV